MSITTSAMLVDLSISVWTGRKLDKQVSQEVNTDKGAAKDAARVNKNLFAGTDSLEKVTNLSAKIRGEFYYRTLPWSDSGTRLLPTAAFMGFMEWYASAEAEFNKVVGDFIRQYDLIIGAQAFTLGEMFHASEYPAIDQIAHKFRISKSLMPIADVTDWRVSETLASEARLVEDYEATMKSRLEGAMADAWSRTHLVLTRMSDRLTVDDGKKRIFRDSLVDNALELCDMLDAFNVTNDPAMFRTRQELQDMLMGVTTDELRKNDAVRSEVKTRVDTMLEAFTWNLDD